MKFVNNLTIQNMKATCEITLSSVKVLDGFLSKAILKAKSRKISSLNLKERSYALLVVKTTQRNSSLQIPEPPASKANLKKILTLTVF